MQYNLALIEYFDGPEKSLYLLAIDMSIVFLFIVLYIRHTLLRMGLRLVPRQTVCTSELLLLSVLQLCIDKTCSERPLPSQSSYAVDT